MRMPEGNPLIWYVLYLDKNGKKSYEIIIGNSQNEIKQKIEEFAASIDQSFCDLIIFCDTDVRADVTCS
jgi:hypothetical protein